MYNPKGQQVMIAAPGQTHGHDNMGAVNYHTGGSVLLVRKRKRRVETAGLLAAR